MRGIVAVTLVTGLLAMPSAASDSCYEVPLRPSDWHARRDWIGPEKIPDAMACQPTGEEGLAFSVAGPCGQSHAMKWTCSLAGTAVSRYPYLVIVYRGQWLAGQELLSALITDAKRPARPIRLVLPAEVIDDGRWHTLIVRRSVPAEASQLLLALESRDTRSCFHLRRLAFCTTWQDAGTALDVDQSAAADEHDFHQIDLSGRFDASYTKRVERMLARDADPVVRDGGSFFRRSPVRIGGVPYQVATDRDNLIAPPPEPAANKEIIDNYGLRVQRGRVAPISRFWLLAEIADGLDPDLFRMPAWYDPVKKEFRFRPILEEFRRKSGRMPDLVHLWGWTWPESGDYEMRWGDYGEIDFAALGGLPAFRRALDDVQHGLGLPVSLYLNTFLCTRTLAVALQPRDRPSLAVGGKFTVDRVDPG